MLIFTSRQGQLLYIADTAERRNHKKALKDWPLWGLLFYKENMMGTKGLICVGHEGKVYAAYTGHDSYANFETLCEKYPTKEQALELVKGGDIMCFNHGKETEVEYYREDPVTVCTSIEEVVKLYDLHDYISFMPEGGQWQRMTSNGVEVTQLGMTVKDLREAIEGVSDHVAVNVLFDREEVEVTEIKKENGFIFINCD